MDYIPNFNLLTSRICSIVSIGLFFLMPHILQAQRECIEEKTIRPPVVERPNAHLLANDFCDFIRRRNESGDLSYRNEVLYSSDPAMPIRSTGTFIVDNNHQLINTFPARHTLEMVESSIIIVQQGGTYTIEGYILETCFDMWRGIKVEDGGTLIFKNSEIRDAFNAITLDDGATLILDNSTLDYNENGIRHGNNDASAGAPKIDLVGTSQIRCTGDLNNGEWAQNGILMDNGGVFAFNYIGNGGLDISAMHYGAMLDNGAVLSLGNSAITNLVQTGRDGGIGIYTESSSVLLNSLYGGGPWDYTNGVYFQNCPEAGIESRGSNLDINACVFKGEYVRGIFAYRNRNGELIKIRECTFEVVSEDAVAAIEMGRSYGGTNEMSCEITDNTIYLDFATDNAAGMVISGSRPTVDRMNIADNVVAHLSDISNKEAIFISVESADRFFVERNVIYFDNGTPDIPPIGGPRRFGIALVDASNGVDHMIRDNTVARLDEFQNTESGQCGIHVETIANTNTRVCNNTVSGLVHGLHSQRFNAPVHFHENKIGFNEIGVFLAESVTGVQNRNNNQWIDLPETYPQFQARYSGADNPFLSRFITQNSNPDILPPNRTPSDGSWFFPQAGPINDCPLIGFTDGGGTGAYSSEIDKELIAGTIYDPVSEPVDYWIHNGKLYSLLHRFPQFIATAPELVQFYNSEATTPLGLLGKASADIFLTVTGVGNLYDTQYKSEYSDIKSNISDIYYGSSSQQASALQSVTANTNDLDALRTQWTTALNTALLSKWTNLNTISTSSSGVDRVYKAVLSARIAFLLDQSILAADKQLIENNSDIADLYRAYAAMLSTCEQEGMNIFYGDHDHHEHKHSKSSQSNKNESTREYIELRANPIQDNRLSLDVLEDLDGLRLTTITGKLIWENYSKEELKRGIRVDQLIDQDVLDSKVLVLQYFYDDQSRALQLLIL